MPAKKKQSKRAGAKAIAKPAKRAPSAKAKKPAAARTSTSASASTSTSKKRTAAKPKTSTKPVAAKAKAKPKTNAKAAPAPKRASAAKARPSKPTVASTHPNERGGDAKTAASKRPKRSAPSSPPDGDFVTRILAGEFSEKRKAELLRAAAERGVVAAQIALAKRIFWSPDGDAEEAVHWMQTAAASGAPEATYLLGLAYYRGRGVGEADPVRSRALHLEAAKRGDPDAQFEMSILLDKGIGGAVDVDGAREWERKAAEAGQPRACLNMAVWAATGKFGAQDMDVAVRWYERAASNGSAVAASRLARMFAGGIGVAQDETLGQKWYERATGLGYDWSSQS